MTRLLYGALKEVKSNRDGWSFGLTLRFGLEKFKFFRFGVFPRQISIGVTEATISFRLEDAIMPDEDWAFDTPTSLSIDIHRENTWEVRVDQALEQSKGKSLDFSGSGEGQVSSKVTIGAAFKKTVEDKRSKKMHCGKKNLELRFYQTLYIYSFFWRSRIPSVEDYVAI